MGISLCKPIDYLVIAKYPIPTWKAQISKVCDKKSTKNRVDNKVENSYLPQDKYATYKCLEYHQVLYLLWLSFIYQS